MKHGTPLHTRIQLSSEAPLESLEWVTLGDIAIPVPFEVDAMDLDVTVSLPDAVVSTWYYLRARQTDGALIYASPVFIDIIGDNGDLEAAPPT